ncbi:MAG: ABC transporter permease [Clostridiales Family XIII bacterium]|jgi:osmoprotectant transport system permease protein|nr:ABC transporter permease [Clostridiales Family XIII bacterium]
MGTSHLIEKIIEYFRNKPDVYAEAFATHIMISAICVGIACAVGIPLGIACAKSRRVRLFVTGVFSTLRIVPSLAVLFICMPIFGIGLTPALIALSFLAIPPVLINTTQAFAAIPRPVIETAEAMGMTGGMALTRVKFPLAAPLILAGVKTATVEVIASATLAAYIGAGGLGNIIFTGLGLLRPDLLIIGGASVAALSVVADTLLSKLEKRLVRYRDPGMRPRPSGPGHGYGHGHGNTAKAAGTARAA